MVLNFWSKPETSESLNIMSPVLPGTGSQRAKEAQRPFFANRLAFSVGLVDNANEHGTLGAPSSSYLLRSHASSMGVSQNPCATLIYTYPGVIEGHYLG